MVVVVLIEMVVVGWVVGRLLVNVKIISIEKKSEEKKRYLVDSSGSRCVASQAIHLSS